MAAISAIGAATSYMFYWNEFGQSLTPFLLSIAITVVAAITPFLVYFTCSRSGRLYALPMGILAIVAFLSIYCFFGLAAFFFYITYAPLPPAVQALGYIVGFGGHLWWLWISYSDLSYATEKTKFYQLAYEERADGFIYFDRELWNRKIPKIMDKRDLPHQGQMWAALAIAPIAPFLGRLFSPDFQALGVTTFLAYLSLPLSLWLLRAIFFPFISLIWYPLKIKRLTGKVVVLDNQ